MKKLQIAALFLLIFNTTYPKNIIWDLGDVLLGVSKLGIAQEVGINNFINYLFLDWKSPSAMQSKAFALLREIKNESEQELYDTYVLPDLFQELMEGKLTSTEIIELALNKIEEFAQADLASEKKYFCSEREEKLLKKTILAMFTPSILAKNSYPLFAILEIVKECGRRIDSEGNPEHQLFILSNFASDAFDELYTQTHTNVIFGLFNKENIVISGKIKAAKPSQEAFMYMLDTFKLQANDCIFIDDRKENIEAAEAIGMSGIQLCKPDPNYLRKKLQELAIL